MSRCLFVTKKVNLEMTEILSIELNNCLEIQKVSNYAFTALCHLHPKYSTAYL